MSVDVDVTCFDLEIDVTLDGLTLIFPGSIDLQIPAPPGVDIAFALDYAKQFLAAAGAALTPLRPVFNIIDAIVAIANLQKVIPEAIIKLDPGKITAALPNVAAKVDKLLALIPPLSLPPLIKSILKMIVVFLRGIQFALQAIIDALLDADIALGRAGELEIDFPEISANLHASADCVKANAAASLGGLSQGAQPMNSLVGIIQIFVDMIGLVDDHGLALKVPKLQDLGADAEVAVTLVGSLADVMNAIQIAIVF